MDKERMKGFSRKVFADMAGGMAAGLAYLGTKTGLFEAMAGKGALTQERAKLMPTPRRAPRPPHKPLFLRGFDRQVKTIEGPRVADDAVIGFVPPQLADRGGLQRWNRQGE